MHISRRSFTASALLPAFLPLMTNAQPASAMLDVEMAGASDRIQTLGRYIPGGLLDTDLALAWIDPERQLFHMKAGTNDEERTRVFTQSQFGAFPGLFSNISQLTDVIGFDIPNVMQAAAAFQLPDNIQIFRLNLDVQDLVSVWTEAGYEQKENEVGEFWTIGEDGEFDLKHPVQGIALASLNNIAFLDEHVIACSPTSSQLEQIMATASGDQPNALAEIEPLTAVLLDESISAATTSGEYFDREGLSSPIPELIPKIDEGLAESDETVGPMPVIRTALAGTTQGAALQDDLLDENAVAYLILQTEGDAELAAEVIAWRFENLHSLASAQSYSEILGETVITVDSDEILRITSKKGALNAVFNRMIMLADILPFAYRAS